MGTTRRSDHFLHFPVILSLIVLFSLACSTTRGGNSGDDCRSAAISGEARFLLTFDDGPAVTAGPSPTISVLELLSRNALQPGIKAIFFVQTRAPRHGGAEEGRRIMALEHDGEHILGIHSGSARGHVNHTAMRPEELQQSLRDGMGDIQSITGRPPLFVRPPFWRYNAETLSRYERNGLHMLLSDVKAYDGGSGLFHFNSEFSSQRHGNMLSELQRVAVKIRQGEIPSVHGIYPVIVTFHDTNVFTASHLEEYLRILVEEAHRAGIPLGSKPFYDSQEEVETAALQRAEHRVLLETRLPARLARFFKGK